MISGTTIGFVCVVALLMAAILTAVIDKKERAKGHAEKSRFLSRLALGLFITAFIGGVAVTLKDPKDVPSRERLGHLYLQMQDYENVFRLAHEAIQIDPKSSESHAHMGIVQMQGTNDPKGAKESWESFLKVAKPNDPGLPRVKMFLEMVSRQTESGK